MTTSMRLLVKTSETNSAPQPSDLISRELAFSFVSGGLFIKYPDNTVRQINTGGNGTVTWASILGNVSDSASLTNALSTKQDLLSATGGIVLNGTSISVDYTQIANKPFLGNSSGLNVGTTPGTVAAGDHVHNKIQVGLGNVDNTSDLDKPLSNAVILALSGKQDVLTAGTGISIQNGIISATGTTGSATVTWDSILNKPTLFPPSAHSHVKSDVGLGNVDNTSDLNKPISTLTQAALDQKVSLGLLGALNGVATLDATGDVPLTQIPPSIQGSIRYQGLWNASTNSPTIPAASSANKGFYYKVSANGTTSIDGNASWNIGDWILSNGTTWDRVQPSGSVLSVAGKFGTVTLTKADVGLANVDNTSDVNKPISSATQAALNLKVDTSMLGAPSGVATLVSNSKVNPAQLPDSALTSLNQQGTWNASTNTPTIPVSSSANKGWFYIVNIAGSTAIDGTNLWEVGDWILSTGSGWIKVQPSNRVLSVNGKTGTVVLQISDIPGLQTALSNAGAVLSVAGKTGNVVLQISDISGLTAALTTAGAVTSVAGRTGDVYLTKADVGLANVDNTSDVNKPISSATQAALDQKASNSIATTTVSGLLSAADKTKLDGIASGATANSPDSYLLNRTNHTGTQAISTIVNLQTTLDAKEVSANKGAANGYAPLDANSKVPTANLPDTVVGSLNYQGAWDASTNTPTIPVASSGNKGFYYKVNVAGNTTIDGNSTWNIGDLIVSNGTVWERIQTQNSVNSVAGKTGDVLLVKADVGLSNVDNTSDLNKPISTATQAALDAKASTALASSAASGLMSFGDKAKLDTIATGATVNSTDLYLLNRANHTGTQAISTVSGLQSALDAKQNTLTAGAGISIVNNTISLSGSTSAVKQAGTAMLTNVTSSTSSVTILNANTARLGMLIVNDTNQPMYIAFAATASTTSYSVLLQAGDTYESGAMIYTGQVTAIWTGTPTGAARVTEFTS
ncbi:MAG TPA: hypothetical protein VFM18_07260 [Methanosarcina sp.]|nr:hypothetical protein [Methanosarcina sp.]